MKASKLKINDVYTGVYGFEPEGRIEVPTPERNDERIELPGRDGDLFIKGAYKNIILPVRFTMLTTDSFKTEFRKSKMHLLNAETLIFDDDPDVFYKVKNVRLDAAENLVTKFGEFTVRFILDPFQYEIESDVHEITKKTTINNPGHHSEPVFIVHCIGTGKLFVNEEVVTIRNVGGTITIDSQTKSVYRNEKGIKIPMYHHMVGNFPVLNHGQTTIFFDGDITKVEITKNFRWI